MAVWYRITNHCDEQAILMLLDNNNNKPWLLTASKFMILEEEEEEEAEMQQLKSETTHLENIHCRSLKLLAFSLALRSPF